MAQSLHNDRKLVGTPRQTMMHHLCNQMEDDCSERFDSSAATAAPVTVVRSMSGDERLGTMDFLSSHESRPNNLVSVLLI